MVHTYFQSRVICDYACKEREREKRKIKRGPIILCHGTREQRVKRSRRVAWQIKIVSFITFISFDASANSAHTSAAVLPFGLLLGVQGNHGVIRGVHGSINYISVLSHARRIVYINCVFNPSRATHFGHSRPTFSAKHIPPEEERDETHTHKHTREIH